MDMTTPSVVDSHEEFRQVMMQRLHAQSQELSTALGNVSTPGSAQSGCASPSYEARRWQKHTQRDAMAEHLSERVSSPASRALESIRSALGTLPAEPAAASSADATPPAGSSRPSTAGEPCRSSSRQPSNSDASHSGSAQNASINEAEHERRGMLPGVERELNRLLGPKKAPAGPLVSRPRLQSTSATAAAAAGPRSDSSSPFDEPDSLARVHSNPLFREDRDSASVAGPQVLQALESGSDGAGLRKTGQVVGTAGQALNMSVRLVILGLHPSFSKCCTCFWQACFLDTQLRSSRWHQRTLAGDCETGILWRV